MRRYRIQLLIAFAFLFSCSTPEPVGDKLFTELGSNITNIRFSNDLEETRANNHLNNDMFISGAGLGIGDLNNDGLPDIVFSGNQVGDAVYINKGDMVFQDITASSGIQEDVKRWSTGVSLVDINNDGWLDIYICKNVQENIQASGNKLYINNGDLTFTESAAKYGLEDRGFSNHASFFDYDSDGDLDVYVVNQPPSLGNRTAKVQKTLNQETLKYSDRLYENREGYFFDVTQEAGLLSFGYGFIALAGDLNGDNRPDIYVTNDYDRADFMYINQGNGSFKNLINQRAKHISNFSMGGDLADYDNDGLLDLMVVDMVSEDHKRIKTNMSGMDPSNFWNLVNLGWHYQYMFNTLQKNNGNGTFSELAHLGGVSNTDWSWGALFADLDKDGFKDLYVTNGVIKNSRYSDLKKKISHRIDSLELVSKRTGKPLKELIDVMDFVEMTPTDFLQNAAFKNNQDLTFKRVSDEWGFDKKDLSNGVAYADLDLDGDLDLVTNNINNKAKIYRNNSSDSLGWLSLNLQPEESVLAGTKIKVYLNDGSIQYEEVILSRGYMSQSSQTPFFGLQNKKVDSIRVRWNSGRVTTLRSGDMEGAINVSERDGEILKRSITSRKARPFQIESSSNFRHSENEFNDYDHQVLLPFKRSNQGPLISVGDVNNDKLQDFFIGGAMNKPGSFFIQKTDGKFKREDIALDSAYEDIGSVMFDYDSDGDDDLYVISGGNEFEEGSQFYQDRIYENRGNSVFVKDEEALPLFNTSGGKVLVGDYDQDGDDDLLVLGRHIPRKYPLPASSKLLQNNDGKFVDVTKRVAPQLKGVGLLNDGEWLDYDNDGDLDFILVGEWSPIMIFNQKDGVFNLQETNLDSLSGWFFSIHADDMDQDGDLDLLVGNLGLNAKYKASADNPFEVYGGDIDQNGSSDIVLTYLVDGERYPVRGKSCSSEQIPDLSKRFTNYESFSNANITDLFGQSIEEQPHLNATTFASMYIENRSGNFYPTPLPNAAQVSVVNSFITEDFDGDGHKDVLLAGNLYPVEIETPRFDAGVGLYLKGDGNGGFEPLNYLESGFFAPLDVRDMALLEDRNGNQKVVVANNKDRLQYFSVNNNNPSK